MPVAALTYGPFVGVRLIRQYWREPQFWLWWWHNQVSWGVKMLGLLAFVAASSFAVGAMVSGGIFRGANSATFVPQRLDRNMSVELFIADFDRVLRADSILYKRWKALNPVEAAEYEEYVERAAQSAWPQPVMRTPFGRALIAAASIATGDAAGRLGGKTAPERS